MYIWSSLELLQQQNSQDGAFISGFTQQQDALMGEQFWNFCRNCYNPAVQDHRPINSYTTEENQNEQHEELARGSTGTSLSQQMPCLPQDIANNVENISQWILHKGQEEQQQYRRIPLRERRLKCSDKLHLNITMETPDAKDSKSLQACIKDMTDVSDVLSPLPLTPNYMSN